MSAQAQKSSVAFGPIKNLFVGRQPIYNGQLGLYGYELLFRNNLENKADVLDGNQATSQVMTQTFLEIGLEHLVGHHKAFFNLTQAFITGSLPVPFSKKQVVLEVLENIPATVETIEGLHNLKKQGYTIALDDFVLTTQIHPFVELADIIKVDILQDASFGKKQIRDLHYKGIKLLAEKIETKQQFEACRQLDFDFYQGYFLSRPQIVQGKHIPENKNLLLYLLARLQDPDIEFGELQELIKRDPALSFKLLRYINSPAVGLASAVQSIQQAITIIGLDALKRWVTLIVVATVADKTGELIRIALTRAKMCELLGVAIGKSDQDIYFTVGLFSALDTMLDVPLEQVLKSLPFSGRINDALLKHVGIEGEVLQCVLSYELSDWQNVKCGALSVDAINQIYVQAITWSDESFAFLTQT